MSCHPLTRCRTKTEWAFHNTSSQEFVDRSQSKRREGLFLGASIAYLH